MRSISSVLLAKKSTVYDTADAEMCQAPTSIAEAGAFVRRYLVAEGGAGVAEDAASASTGVMKFCIT